MKIAISLTGLTAGLLLIFSEATAQDNLNTVLSAIAQNNKSIKAYRQLVQSRKVNSKTGLYPENPTLEYDYMEGSPAGAGNQTDITFIQSFDFPTAYGKRKKLSEATIEKLDILFEGYKQDILLEASQAYLELVYLNKRKNQLMVREQHAGQLEKAFQEQLERGEASILDMNKASIELLDIRNELRLTGTEIDEWNQKLTELNGGTQIHITATDYPLMDLPASMDSLINKAETADFTLQAIRQDREISQRQVQLTRALALPKLEVGYRYQAILQQNFNGFHTGVSIPLFENKNKVRAAKEQNTYYRLLEESHVNQHHNELEALYNKARNLRQSVRDFQSLLGGISTEKLLDKALQAGEISVVTYFMELAYYYQAHDQLLLEEKQYYHTLVELKRYEL